MQELQLRRIHFCPILQEPFKYPVTIGDGHHYELYAIAQHFQGKTKAQLKSPLVQTKLITEVIVDFDLLDDLDTLYAKEKEQQEARKKAKEDKIARLNAEESQQKISDHIPADLNSRASKGKEHVEKDDIETTPTALEPRHSAGYLVYSKDDYLTAINAFLTQNDPNLKFSMPPKEALQAARSLGAIGQNERENARLMARQGLFNQPQNGVLASMSTKTFQFSLLSSVAVSLLSAGYEAASSACNGANDYNNRFLYAAAKAKYDFNNSCNADTNVLDSGLITNNLLRGNKGNNIIAIIQGCALLPALTIAYGSLCLYAKTQRPSDKSRFWGLVSLAAFSLTILGLINWMLTTVNGYLAGYNAEYAYLCYKSDDPQNCKNQTPQYCNNAFNGTPPHDFNVTDFLMNKAPGYDFFTSGFALVILIAVNAIFITTLYRINYLIHNRRAQEPVAGNNPDNINGNNAPLVPPLNDNNAEAQEAQPLNDNSVAAQEAQPLRGDRDHGELRIRGYGAV